MEHPTKGGKQTYAFARSWSAGIAHAWGAPRLALVCFLLGLLLGCGGEPAGVQQSNANLTITSYSPKSGPPTAGVYVTVTGTNFTNVSFSREAAADNGAVTGAEFFQNVGGQVQNLTPTTLATAVTGTVAVVNVPRLAPGNWTLAFISTDRSGKTTQQNYAGTYFVQAAPVAFLMPTVTSVTPDFGPPGGGATVVISGDWLVDATGVNFGFTPGTGLKVISNSSVQVTSPPGTLGIVHVTVVTLEGVSATTSNDQFAYETLIPAVNSVKPNTGPAAGGNTVSVAGSSLTGAKYVNFGSQPATNVVVESDSLITATAPPGSGIVDVTIVTPAGFSAETAADKYTYTTTVLPTVTGVTPSSVIEPYTVPITIFGTGLTGATEVSFVSSTGSVVQGSEIHVVSNTELTVMAPINLKGVFNVVVTTPAGMSPITAADEITIS
jgi:IPT/TIG domain